MRHILYKIFAIAYALLVLQGFGEFGFLDPKLILPLAIAVLAIDVLSIVGVFALAYRVKLLFPRFWQFILYAFVINIIISPTMGTMVQGVFQKGDFRLLALLVFFFVIPGYLLFQYAFKSEDLWKAKKEVEEIEEIKNENND
jgi:hypothetical protein